LTENTGVMDNPAALWCFALDAQMNEMNGLDLETNYAWEHTEEDIAMHKHSLERDWSIHNREDLLEAVERLKEDGHRVSFHWIKSFLSSLTEAEQLRYIDDIPKSSNKYKEYTIVRAYMNRLPAAGIAAWDWGRYVHLCKTGVYVGYITEDEALELSLPVARMAQQAYSGWQEFGIAFLAGRQFWWDQTTKESAEHMARFVRKLILHPNSVWNRLDWHMPLNSAFDTESF